MIVVYELVVVFFIQPCLSLVSKWVVAVRTCFVGIHICPSTINSILSSLTMSVSSRDRIPLPSNFDVPQRVEGGEGGGRSKETFTLPSKEWRLKQVDSNTQPTPH